MRKNNSVFEPLANIIKETYSKAYTCGKCHQRPEATYDGVFTCNLCGEVVTDDQQACEDFISEVEAV